MERRENYLKSEKSDKLGLPGRTLPAVEVLPPDDYSNSNSNSNGSSTGLHVVNFSRDFRNRAGSDISGHDIDSDSDVISNLIGHYGWWQFIWTFLLCLFQLPTTFHIFAFVFQSIEKEFWCARPDNMKDMNASMWMNLTQPRGACSIANFKFTEMHEENLELYLERPDPMNLTKCHSFEYSDADGAGQTLVSEYNLVCDQKNLLSVVEMCFLAGAAVGSVCSGWISDRFGRRHTLMIFATIQTIIGTLLTFSRSLVMFMTLRVVIGFASMSVTVVSFVLVVELVSGKWRTIIGILNILPVAITYIITAGIAYFIRDWRLMQLIISAPWFALLLMWYCLPESPRWLLARGRLEELKRLIERACRMNGRTLQSNYEKSLEAYPKDQDPSVPLFIVFNKEFRRTTLLTLVVWFTLILIYFGITLHLSNLGGNIYVNTAIAGGVEAFSICVSILVVLKLGIRINLVIYMLVAGIACLVVNFIPDGNLWAIITLAMIVKCTIGANNAIIPTFTARQYPVVMRNLGVGVGNFAAGIALIVVPYLWLLEHIQIYLPMTVMGICGIIGAIALMFMKSETPSGIRVAT